LDSSQAQNAVPNAQRFTDNLNAAVRSLREGADEFSARNGLGKEISAETDVKKELQAGRTRISLDDLKDAPRTPKRPEQSRTPAAPSRERESAPKDPERR
jgi:hypothetical protein